MNKLVVGLFGTCGGSVWRDKFIAQYDVLGIEYFNPQVDDWKPEDAEVEADHLATDQIILFPVLAETWGLGSLGEIGFSIAQAMRYDDRRDFVFLIDKFHDESLKPLDNGMENPLYKESCRMRALQLAHIRKWNLSNVFLVETLDEMLHVSIELHKANKIRTQLRSEWK